MTSRITGSCYVKLRVHGVLINVQNKCTTEFQRITDTLNLWTGTARSTCEVAEVQLLPHGQHVNMGSSTGTNKQFQWEECR